MLQIFNSYYEIYWTNARHVGTYSNAFSMVIPYKVMKFNNVDIFKNVVDF